ncbi:RNA polymerase II [Orbilia brochopaga]|uniref:RNA polymerase II subunit A C-terminal domain phosphatase n=1 Tax=Orbilia brochopaga TaxID=3140254 RepID=A0AAV9UXZ5_9PEZI
MLLQLPPSTRFPVTITQIHFAQNAEVKKLQAIFTFSYKSLITEDNEDGEEVRRLTDIISKFETPVGGKILRWMVGKGSVVSSPSTNIVEIEEPCPHPVVWNNQCAVCGADLSEQTYINYHNPETANINVTHDNTGLKISRGEAENIEKEAKKRLLSSKKLSLVVDLDQTIIQATVDPTVGEWRDDASNPNYDAVKDVEAFQLLDEGAGGRGCWYYVKLRPGLKRFLENISKLYECHIYTMGTRAYAMSIAKIVDPQGDIFGERILSRDESGSLTSKSLERLFPVDTKMVVIIDDRGDVWKWSDNLIKVTPYDFFVGIGDINSSFLPKRHDYQLAQQAAQQATATNNVVKTDDPPVVNPEHLTVPAVPTITVENGSEDTQMSDSVEEKKKEEVEASEEVSPLEQLVEMGGGDDPDVLAEQTSRQNEALTAQQKERPLAKKQEVLDKQDSDGTSSNHSNNGDTNSDSGHRHNLLHDNDNELEYLEKALTEVHQEFFEEYQRRLVASKGGRVAQVRGGGGKGGKRAPRGNSDSDAKSDYLKNVPDIKHIMPRMKRRVFDNTVLVFSGVIPLGVDVQSSDIAQWAKSFGAIVVDGVSASVTHVVAARTRTAKVRSAATKFSHIKIVTPQWFFQSIAMWQKLDETPFLINVYPEDRFANSSPPLPSSSMGFDDLEDQMELSSDEEEDDDDGDSDINTLDGRPGVIPDLMLPEESEPPPDLHDLNWDEMDRDLADFMGSEADDTDLESRNGAEADESDGESASGDPPTNEGSLKVSLSNNKRDRSATPPPDGADEQARVTPAEPREKEKEFLKSPLSKRVRLSNSRSSSLRNLTLSAEEPQIGETGMPSPAQSNGGEKEGSVRGDEEEDDFDLEAEFANEFA